MSESAGLSQLVGTEMLAQTPGLPGQSVVDTAQADDFSDFLQSVEGQQQAQSPEMLALQQKLAAEMAAQNISAALLPQATDGNTLPPGVGSTLSAAQFIQQLKAAGLPFEGEATTTLLLQPGKATLNQNPLLNADATAASTDPKLPIALGAQLKAQFNQETLSGSQNLEHKLFDNLNQALSTNTANPLLAVESSQPISGGFMLNHTVSVSSNSAVLPVMTVMPDNPQFSTELGHRINWMANNSIQQAELRLDPPELGGLDVRLSINKDNQASIIFHVANTSAKEAIESAIPRLREMFAQQGIDLGNVDVSQQNLSQQHASYSENNNTNSELSLPEQVNHDPMIPMLENNIHIQGKTNLLDVFV